MEYMSKGHMLADVVAIIGRIFIFLYIVLVIPLVPVIH